jgi:DNA-binding GntR family transcriptional regulator
MTGPQGALLTESVHRRLREEVLSGVLLPGAPLSVPALAARLEVSRSPVRESVQQLIHEGLAVHTPRAGARVATLDDEAMRAVLQVREVLDGLAAGQATARATLADVAGLREVLAEQERLLGSPADQRRDAELDLAFHTAVRSLAGNAPLSAALLRLDTQAHLHRSDMWAHDLDRRLALAEHRLVVERIEAGDVVGADAAARAHVAGLLVRLSRRPAAPA